MTLTNYWWLLIWLFVGGGVLSFLFPKQPIEVLGKTEYRWSWTPAIILACPYAIWAGFRHNLWGDTGSYMKIYRNLPNTFGEIFPYMESITKDEGFYFLSAVFKCMLGDSTTVYLLFIGILQISILTYVYRKYSCDYWFSVFVFVASTDYMSWCHNGMRQFLAVCVVLCATKWILEKRYIIAIVIVLLASTLHGSALLMLPIIFIVQGKAFNTKTLMCILAALIILAYVDQFTNILDELLAETQYTNVVSDWKADAEDDGMNPIRVLVYGMPTILAIMGYRIIKKEDNPLINMCVNASAVSTGIAIVAMGTSGIFIGRLPIYCSLYANGILLPWEIKYLFTEQSSRFIHLSAIICYIAFFYYQMHFGWGLI